MSHQAELEKTLAALAIHEKHAALVCLCRSLAEQLDGAGSTPSSRLSSAYLSALRYLSRTTEVASVESTASSTLRELRARHTPPKRSSNVGNPA